MAKAPVRVVAAMVLAIVVSGCVTITFDPEPTPTPESVAAPVPTTQPNPESTPEPGVDTTQPPNRLPTPRPTHGPAPDVGPPFPEREPSVFLFDHANVFSEITESSARLLLASVARDQGSDVIVYTQLKPESTFESTGQDASALMQQWNIDYGLVIMWNTTRAECQRTAEDNGIVRLYPSPDYAADYLPQTQSQNIFDADMYPWLRLCDEDGALMGALEAIRTAAYLNGGPATGDEPCTDEAFRLIGWRWDQPYQYRFAADSVPDEYDADEVLAVVERSASNITEARNDCGLPDNVAAESEYAGGTQDEPCVEDGRNVIGFGPLPEGVSSDTIALTCPYGLLGDIEADIVINRNVHWALSLDQCDLFQELLEATMTHEFGHVFGLDHVGEDLHGYMTMSPISNGFCQPDEISLGLGDVLGLEELY